MEEAPQRSVTLKNVQDELAALIAATAVVLDECFEQGAAHRLLGLEAGATLFGAMDHIDVEKTVVGRYLPVWHQYAYEAVLAPGYELVVRPGEGSLERLSDLVQLLKPDGSYFDLCLDAVGFDFEQAGALKDMLARLEARYALDSGQSLTVADLALLGNMSERTVRNALSSDSGLTLDAHGSIPNHQALAWLKGRRGYVPTKRRTFPDLDVSTPDALDAVEIPTFVSERLMRIWAEEPFERSLVYHMVQEGDIDAPVPDYLRRAATSVGMTSERLHAAIQLPLRIRPEECEPIAKVIRVEPVWFTLQVMSALYPKQVDMLLNPSVYRSSEDGLPKQELGSVSVVLNQAMLEHGYLDIPASAKDLFPQDCFGTREKDGRAAEVELLYGSHRATTDIRVKSAQTISPRKRLGSWYRTELRAKVGDTIRIERTGERQFALSHVAS